MPIKSVAKTIAKPFKWAWFNRKLNSDITAIRRGHTQAYPLQWNKMRKRYLKSEQALRAFLHRAVDIRRKKVGSESETLEAVGKEIEAIETNLGLPNYTLELQRIVEGRRITIADLKRKMKKEPSKNVELKLGREQFYLKKDEEALQAKIRQALAQSKMTI